MPQICLIDHFGVRKFGVIYAVFWMHELTKFDGCGSKSFLSFGGLVGLVKIVYNTSRVRIDVV